MKNIYINKLIAGVLLYIAFSCQDAINISQDGILDNKASFKTIQDLKQFLLGDIYKIIDVSDPIAFTSLFTDEVGQGPSNSQLYQDIHQFYLDTNNSFASSIWLDNYKIINRVNRLLEASILVKATNSTEIKAKNQILAEARAARAFAYLILETYYSPDMKDNNALGVMILDHVPANDEKLPRSKNAEVFAVIDADIAFAEEHLANSNNYFFFNQNFVKAFKARYYLYRGKYAEAKKYAQKLILESNLVLTPSRPIPSGDIGSPKWHTELNAYSSTNPYIKMWNDSGQGEIIFALSRPGSGSWPNIASVYVTNATNVKGAVNYDMGRNLFNQINANPHDIRRWAFVDPSSLFDPQYETNPNYKNSDVIVIDKYPGKYTGTQPLRNDEKVFRLSEMYFILAECAIHDQQLSLAAQYIHKVRQARQISGNILVPKYANQTQAWADVLKERRIELAFEGHRYIDIKRIGPLAHKSIERHPTDDFDKKAVLTLSNTDYRFTLPIPLNELNKNTELIQNKGY
ncbi:RagB/SusD family nutrient uptake outer membrane protein [Elizabethkingia argentiflava]|uniref:RagB/SusD family nutrient uptake outer membrane protein n=1 Tax=Elizabethkingia argenteiflava TaxID=2681556 RepID=A0A845PWM8_9FLAO|nr:RagB/SusD family nutrient uptake outer membrane protein [Elizabethkingia argenteiflava]NAW52035.1 RagB/SusD family nutrient uptake outer membrane protein [Elizabethkingia argenteiflava]